MSKYPLNPKVISILFDFDDMEMAEKGFMEFEDIIEDISLNAMFKAIKESHLPEERKELVNSEQGLEELMKDEQVLNIINDPDLLEVIDNQVDQIIHRIYVERYPMLSEEKKDELRRHVVEVSQLQLDSTNKLMEMLVADQGV